MYFNFLIGHLIPATRLFRALTSLTGLNLNLNTQIQTIRHNPRGLYYPGKSGDFHVTSFHFRVAKKRPQFNECVMNCNVLMYNYKCNLFVSVRFGSATRTQNFEREVFFYYFSNFPLFLFVKLPDFRSRSLGPAISHCWSLFSLKLRV